MELSSAVTSLLRDNRSVNRIEQVFNEQHEMDFQVLQCFAVHYRCFGVVMQKDHNMFSEFSPLITAINDRNLGLVDFLVTEKRMHECKEGYGIIVGNQLLMNEKLSAWKLMMMRDDDDVLRILLPHYAADLKTLASMAKRFSASKCLAIIKKNMYHIQTNEDTDDQEDIFLIESSKWTQMQKMVLYPFEHIVNIGPMQRESVLIMHESLHNSHPQQLPATTRRYLSEADRKYIKTMRTCDNKMGLFCMLNKTSIPAVPCGEVVLSRGDFTTTSASLDLHSRITLDNCQVVLSKMAAHDPGVMAPRKILSVTLMRMINMLYEAKYIPSNDTNEFAKRLVLNSMIAQLLLQHGVERDSTSNTDFYLIDPRGRFTNSEFFICISIKQLDRELTTATDDMLFQLVQRYIMILLAYGYVELRENIIVLLLWIKSKCVTSLVHKCVSMLTHAGYEAYRLKIIQIKMRLQELREKHSLTEDEMSLAKDCTVAIQNCYDIEGTRSLMQLCRLKIHALLPKGKLPLHVHTLRLPSQLKRYLALDVEYL